MSVKLEEDITKKDNALTLNPLLGTTSLKTQNNNTPSYVQDKKLMDKFQNYEENLQNFASEE